MKHFEYHVIIEEESVIVWFINSNSDVQYNLFNRHDGGILSVDKFTIKHINKVLSSMTKEG